MNKIDGAKIADKIIEKLKEQKTPQKTFVAILVGEKPDSLSFLRKKEDVAKKLGIDFKIHKFAEDISNEDLKRGIKVIASSENVGGIIIQLPLPNHLDRQEILNEIPEDKDIDVLSEQSKKTFRLGQSLILPPAVATIEEILSVTNFQIQNTKIAVVGAGFLVGQPIAGWLENKTKITIFDEQSNPEELKNFDLVISSVGKANLINPSTLKKNASVIDFGYSLNEEKKLSGDLNTQDKDELEKLNFYTPTPGGTGPILVAKIFESFYKLNSN